jgi:hypothetical protein
MSSLRIIGRRGSKSRLAISRAAGIPLYTNGKGVIAIINYGLAGNRLDTFFNKRPVAKGLPIMNRNVARSKFAIVKDAEAIDILVPETRIELTRKMTPSEWIEKKFHSIGGAGIVITKRRCKMTGKYYQKFISDRAYELRIHAFEWIPSDEWVIQKRIGDKDEVAWNYKKGGTFQTVRDKKYKVFQKALEISEKILKMRNMGFGAVDLIVDKNREIYFIEINSAPGFTELSEHIYVEAFKKLKKLSDKRIIGMCI